MRNKTEALLRDEFAGHAAYSVGLVLDAYESRLKVLNELVLALSELSRLFLRESGRALPKSLECWRRVTDIIA